MCLCACGANVALLLSHCVTVDNFPNVPEPPFLFFNTQVIKGPGPLGCSEVE